MDAPASLSACPICGDSLHSSPSGFPFVACLHCGFPVCRPCYLYERKDGTQACPHCKHRYPRLKGTPRIEGDEDEEELDDLDEEYEVDFDTYEKQQIAEAMLHGHMSYGRGDDRDMPRMVQTTEPQTPPSPTVHRSQAIPKSCLH